MIARTLGGRLVLAMLAVTAGALLTAGIALAIYDARTYRAQWLAELVTQADVLARASGPALLFDDVDAARANLQVLRAGPAILSAALYNGEDRLFADYRAEGAGPPPNAPTEDGAATRGSVAEVVRPVVEGERRVGTVYLQAQYNLVSRVQGYLAILATVMLGSLFVAGALAQLLQAKVTRPIRELTAAARQVVERRDYSARVQRATTDEIGYLVDAFNSMLNELGQRANALETADRRKDEFLAMLAHELRNPLGPIRNGVAWMRRRFTADGETVQTLAMIERQGRNMTRLVDDLLDAARISRGKIEIKPVLGDLRDAVRDGVEVAQEAVRRKQQSLSVTLPEEPVPFSFDRVRMAQAVWNLLDNASKFTDDGGNVRVELVLQDGAVTIAVIDTGRGIDAKLIHQVFDLFVQADTGLDRANGGLGIGLALVRRISELHGGSVSAASAGKGHGTKFLIRLPAAGSRSPSQAAQRGAAIRDDPVQSRDDDGSNASGTHPTGPIVAGSDASGPIASGPIASGPIVADDLGGATTR